MGPLVILLGWMAAGTSSGTPIETVSCLFPPENAADETIRITVTSPLQNGSDRRISMVVNDKTRMHGIVQPTAERRREAVLIHGISKEKSIYTIGLHQNGTAVFKIHTPGAQDGPSLVGACKGHRGPMQDWIEPR